jgi:hypothetical protein
MKKHIYLFSTVLVLSIFSSITAKADDSLLGGILGDLGLGGNSTPTTPANQPTTLPIYNAQLFLSYLNHFLIAQHVNIAFLTVAGVAFGIVTIKKAKKSSTAQKGNQCLNALNVH